MKRISNDEYYKLFCSWQGSGVGKAASATKESISMTSFYYWCRKFDGDDVPTASSSPFSLLAIDSPGGAIPVVRIRYPSEVSVELFGAIDAVTVRELVS